MKTKYPIPDWSQLIEDLQEVGWSQMRIADEIEVTQPTISRLLSKDRMDPLASVALPLMALHKREMANAKRRRNREELA